ncbi:hypothetical protein H0H81_007035 [Sphagnurus paluster]|uniref:Transferase family protein n=1 Tax=Sphagnurus paluster TaxID=117069 RepID=A0A9P7K8S5_9AGAR|nr:hypothetical protein H0H81_007035 [Sphagnurus paluster]
MPVLSRTRIFPDIPASTATHTPLSIIDCKSAPHPPAAAVWFYHDGPACTVDQLTTSLRKTLNAYPQLSGQLHWATYNPHGDHTERFQRVTLSYGTPDDPGVELIVATTSQELSPLTVEPPEGFWASILPIEEFLNSTPLLALNNGEDSETGLPCVAVQITILPDQGIAIAVKICHALADAQSLLQFTHDWASTNRAMFTGTPLPALSPVFDPAALDRAAAGNIDAPHPDPAILELARDLPLHRYDTWASAVGSTIMFPAAAAPQNTAPVGPPPPWANWDPNAPVSYYLLNFSAPEIKAMWTEASATSRVSHLDAMLAHLWRLIIRARALEGEHHLDLACGFRARLDPPLPPSFLGSPSTSAAATTTLADADASTQALGHLAAAIRTSLSAFTSKTIPALLHEMAFDASPLRVSNVFLGAHNTACASWLRLGIQDVDFGAGRPAYVEPILPYNVDGVFRVAEATGNHNHAARWYDGSVTVSLFLRDDVMQKLLRDPDLRKYRK